MRVIIAGRWRPTWGEATIQALPAKGGGSRRGGPKAIRAAEACRQRTVLRFTSQPSASSACRGPADVARPFRLCEARVARVAASGSVEVSRTSKSLMENRSKPNPFWSAVVSTTSMHADHVGEQVGSNLARQLTFRVGPANDLSLSVSSKIGTHSSFPPIRMRIPSMDSVWLAPTKSSL